MLSSSKTFRIFISSTFSDLKEERNALQESVFPKLRELCLGYGCRFQAIDLRWGVSEEAALDQQTMNICLQELERCQSITPRPNFIILLGDRYGWCPLPPQIKAEEFEAILDKVTPEDKELLFWDALQPDNRKGWYRRDENAIPSEYSLRPREVKVPDNASNADKQVALDREAQEWVGIENKLRSMMLQAIEKLGWLDDDPRRTEYEASATHQEILHGALEVPDAHEHVYCFFRKIEGLPEGQKAKGFIDMDETNNHAHKEAQEQLEKLKNSLGHHLPGNIFKYKAKWTGSGTTTDHLNKLCQDVYEVLSRVIEKEASALEEIDTLDKEISDHESFGQERARFFTGRINTLQSISDYLESTDNHPLAIFGDSGSGKTALIAHAVQKARANHPDAEVVIRFIGATPSSTDGRSLLESLCRQLLRYYGTDESIVSTEYRELVREFPKRLSLVTKEKPLIVFLDALDQLSNNDRSRNLVWLPVKLPEHVHFIVSSLPSECLSILQRKLPGEKLVKLEPMPPEEGQGLLNLWLEDASRTLQPHQREEVLSKFEQCGSPLYLKLAFEEARRWKSYAPKKQLSQDVSGIIRNLFERVSSDANHGRIMVSHSFGYLAAAKNGLTEDELLDMLSYDKDLMDDFRRRSPKSPPVDRLPVVVWARLYSDLQTYLAERTGDGTSLMTFYHPQLGNVAAEDYLVGEAGRERHQALAQYFAAQNLYTEQAEQKAPNLRKVSELSYQQTCGEDWAGVEKTLSDLTFLEAKCRGLQKKEDEFNRLQQTGVFNALEDFTFAIERLDKIDSKSEQEITCLTRLRVLQEQIWEEVSMLSQFPSCTIQQLTNRIRWSSLADDYLRKQSDIAVRNCIAEGRGVLTSLLPDISATRQSQRIDFGEDIVGVSLAPEGYVLWNRNGYWRIVDETGALLREGGASGIVFQQVAAGDDVVILVSGRTLRYWLTWPDSGEKILTLPFSAQQITLSAQGHHLLAIGIGGEWSRYNIIEGKITYLDSGQIEDSPLCCAIDGMGKHWVIGTLNGAIYYYDGQKVKNIAQQNSQVQTCALSSDGQIIVTGGKDGTLRATNSDGTETYHIDCGGWLNQVSLGVGDNQLFAVTEDGKVLVVTFNSRWGLRLETWVQENTPLTQVCPNHSGTSLVTVNTNLRASIVKRPSDRTLDGDLGVSFSGQIKYMEETNKGQTIVAVDSTGQTCSFDIKSSQPKWQTLYKSSGSVVATAHTRKENELIMVHKDLGAARIVQVQLDLHPKKEIVWPRKSWGQSQKELSTIDAASFSPDKKTLVLSHATTSSYSASELEVIDTSKWKHIAQFSLVGAAQVLAIANDASRIMVGYANIYQKPALFERKTSFNKPIEIPLKGCRAVDISADGNKLAIVEHDGDFWFAHNVTDNASFEKMGKNVTCCSFSLDGRWIILGNEDRKIALIALEEQANDPRVQRVFRAGLDWQPMCCKFHPQSNIIMIGGDKAIQVFRLLRGDADMEEGNYVL